MPVSSDSTPPHGLQLVIDFVNTADLEAGSDSLDTPGGLAAWLGEHGLCEHGLCEHGRTTSAPRRRELGRAIALREALRAVMLGHNGGEEDASAAETLERVAEQGRLSVRFRADGAVELEPRAGGTAGALARVLVPVARAAADGSWARVKACRADDCHWAFYDHSRNRSGRWCDMAVCGNRTKVRAYREKRGPR